MLFEKVPSVSEQLLNELNLDVAAYKKKFDHVYRQWGMNSSTVRDETDEGRLLFSAVKRCISDKDYMVVLADDYKKFNEYCTQKNINKDKLLYWLDVACAFGSKKIATAIMNTLKTDLRHLDDGSNKIIAYIAAADLKWLEEILVKNDHHNVPDSAYTYVSISSHAKVKAMDDHLIQAHAKTIDDDDLLHPSNGTDDDQLKKNDSGRQSPPIK